MLELINVSKVYDSPGSPEGLCVLEDINLTVDTGRSLAVVGPSGCGKSTLLNIIGALDSPTFGQVLLDGSDISELSQAQLSEVRNTKIGFIFQLHHLLPQCTVLENILLPTLAGYTTSSAKALEHRANELLERVGLKDFAFHRPGQLSVGQRQRVAVARALINSPQLLLADEPTGALDRVSSENIANLLIELNQSENITLIVVTHSAELAGRMGRQMQLTNGTLKEEMSGA